MLALWILYYCTLLLGLGRLFLSGVRPELLFRHGRVTLLKKDIFLAEIIQRKHLWMACGDIVI